MKAKRRSRIHEASPNASSEEHARQEQSTIWRDHRFEMSDDGLFFDSDDGRVRVCDKFSARSRTRDFEWSSHGLLIKWVDEDLVQKEANILHKDMASPQKIAAGLRDRGLRIEHGQERNFVLALRSVKPTSSSWVTTDIGWQPGNIFVLPSQVIGDCEEEVSLLPGPVRERHFICRGTLQDWKAEVASKTRGNSRLMFAIAVALSGPLLDPIRGANAIFHIHGPSSTGKTSAARLAATVWGPPSFNDGFPGSWKITSNAVELAARNRRDCCLILDEINMAEPKEVAAAAYLLSSGIGKNRMGSNRSLEPTSKWRVPVLSTGEYSFPHYLESGGMKATGGQSVRFASLPADAGKQMGILEDIKDSESPSQFISALHAACDDAYGTPGPAFVRHVAASLDRCSSDAQVLSAQFVEDHAPPGADAQVRRAATMFGNVAAASVIAANAGILPWTADESLWALAACFDAWLSERGHSGSHELEQGIRILREQLLRRESTEIIPWGAASDRAKLGYRREGTGDMDGIYLQPWRVREILKDHDVNAIISELRRQGLARTEKDRIDRVVYHPVTKRNTRFFCISPKFLEEPQGTSDQEMREPEVPTATDITT